MFFREGVGDFCAVILTNVLKCGILRVRHNLIILTKGVLSHFSTSVFSYTLVKKKLCRSKVEYRMECVCFAGALFDYEIVGVECYEKTHLLTAYLSFDACRVALPLYGVRRGDAERRQCRK